jgi:hypothetical protein
MRLPQQLLPLPSQPRTSSRQVPAKHHHLSSRIGRRLQQQQQQPRGSRRGQAMQQHPRQQQLQEAAPSSLLLLPLPWPASQRTTGGLGGDGLCCCSWRGQRAGTV